MFSAFEYFWMEVLEGFRGWIYRVSMDLGSWCFRRLWRLI